MLYSILKYNGIVILSIKLLVDYNTVYEINFSPLFLYNHFQEEVTFYAVFGLLAKSSQTQYTSL